MGRRLLLFGPPGVGKGTHSKRLADDLGISHIATGDMFREEVRRSSEIGLQIAEAIGRGEFVPDELAIATVGRRLDEPDAATGFLLDGFPRTVRQARALEETARNKKIRVDAVLSLEAPVDVLVKRIAGRLTCTRCQRAYNAHYRAPAVTGTCDGCGGALYQRPDDDEAVVRRRLESYVAKTAPVLEFFRAELWPVRSISSVGDADAVYDQIKAAAEG
jgi:adenylate kinase